MQAAPHMHARMQTCRNCWLVTCFPLLGFVCHYIGISRTVPLIKQELVSGRLRPLAYACVCTACTAGEYRGIMSLCRLLPGGFEAKLAVDKAIQSAARIGQ